MIIGKTIAVQERGNNIVDLRVNGSIVFSYNVDDAREITILVESGSTP
jgi:hypothetical protein